MAQSAPPRTKKPTKNPQPARVGASRPARARARRAARSPAFASGAGRPATRGDGSPVIELEYGITVYPAREGQDRWRAQPDHSIAGARFAAAQARGGGRGDCDGQLIGLVRGSGDGAPLLDRLRKRTKQADRTRIRWSIRTT